MAPRAHPSPPEQNSPVPRRTLADRLGHPPGTRLLLLHADDAGMCHSANAATIRAMEAGAVTSTAAMPPCPWFPAFAAWARAHPTLCVGLHFTLTSEWRDYRWGPVAPREQVPGLVDADGFLWRAVEDVRRHASAAEVERELRAQVARARHFGLPLSHADTHMGTLFATPDFFDAYLRVSREAGLLPMLPGPTPRLLEQTTALGLDYAARVPELERAGFVLLDCLETGLAGATLAERRGSFHRLLEQLQPGVTQLIVHLAEDDAEIRSVTDGWQIRAGELQLVLEPATRAALRAAGVRCISYRDLAPLWCPGGP